MNRLKAIKKLINSDNPNLSLIKQLIESEVKEIKEKLRRCKI